MECMAADPDPNPLEEGGDDDDVAPAPPSIGADVPVTYFGPAPSSVNRNLIGPLQLLTAGALDLDAATITLPLYEGRMASGETVWYILTDTTDAANAAALGLNHSSKLFFADGVTEGGTSPAVRDGYYANDAILVFEQGPVDFSPVRVVTPAAAPNEFPPAVFEPGAEGPDYSPLVKIANAGNHIYNAPMVAFGVDDDDLDAYCETEVDDVGRTMIHDGVKYICPSEGTVTLELVPGFSFGRPVLYLSTDANNPLAAALEGAILAGGLTSIQVGGDDSAFSAVERIFGFANGPTNVVEGESNPQRQGFLSALRGEGSPLNVLGGIPTIATDYSPLWDLNLGEWTQDAIGLGYRSRMTEEFAILGLVEQGFVTGLDGGPYGSTGIIINCPIVHRFL